MAHLIITVLNCNCYSVRWLHFFMRRYKNKGEPSSSAIIMMASVTNGSDGKKGGPTVFDKLVTKEDFLHHHKILGLLVLLIIVVRFSLIGQEHDMGFRTYPEWTIPTLLIHFLLNLSSFQFVIPKIRIKNGGARIWPEYRLHAAVFATRSIITILLYHFERKYEWKANYNLNYGIVIGAMLCADLASMIVGQKFKSRSVRDLDAHPATKFFFSFMQYSGNAGLLFGLRCCILPFLVLFVVQTTPFLATLRRKNILTNMFVGVVLYGGMLVYSAFFVNLDYLHAGPGTFELVRTVGNIAALQRMSPLPTTFSMIQNKYVVWTTAFFLFRHFRNRLDEIPLMYLKAAWPITFCGCLGLGYYKTTKELRAKAKAL